MSALGPRPRWWARACTELAAADAKFVPLIEAHPAMRLAARGDAFQTLARSVIGQQISVKAAQSVWNRFAAHCVSVDPDTVVRMDAEGLRACGLSGRKVEYLTSLAQHFIARPGGIDDWSGMDDEGIVAELTAIRGIGVWTAQMFLIFHLARPDVLPLADLGLRRAIELRYSRGHPPAAALVSRLSMCWTPWRTAATWYMWRSLEADPVIH
jgi:DNA-3-methyladenine glycosylase II